MPSIFDLPHVFIVFVPGAGGNFLAGIYTSLINREYSDLEISTTGSSHTTTFKKFSSSSDLSMGTFIDKTFNLDEKIKYHRELFSKLEVTHPLVSWTHDFKNIALYRNIFPNSKIVVVTQNTEEEKLAITCMHVIKNLLDPTVITPIPPAQFKLMRQFHRQTCINILRESFSEHQIDMIMSNPEYSDTVTFIYLKMMINFYGLRHIVEDVPKQCLPDLDKNSPLLLSNKPYEIEKYLTDECTLLPYSYIMSGDITVLLDVIAKTLGKELDINEKIFVENNFNKYRSKQHLALLNNPITYYEQLKRKTDELFKHT